VARQAGDIFDLQAAIKASAAEIKKLKATSINLSEYVNPANGKIMKIKEDIDAVEVHDTIVWLTTI
jgi:hypothetical protein